MGGRHHPARQAGRGLVPPGMDLDRIKARRAAAGLRLASKGQTLDGLSIGALVDEGRR